jgi:hypothetical protein
MRLLVQSEPPIIDLDGYKRLLPVERKLARSPAAVACILATAVGLLVLVSGAVLLSGHVQIPGWDAKNVGGATVLAGTLFCAAAVGLGRAWQLRQLARQRCPHCSEPLVLHIADLEKAEQGRWGDKGVDLDGHWYCAPRLDGDKRPRVRAMKEVRACVSCRVFIDGAAPHDRTCSDDELERLREHSAQRGRGNRAEPGHST